jgi:hypothetical protein
MALYAAGGGFGGALLAIVIAKILAGPCCCPQESPDRTDRRPGAVSSVSWESGARPASGQILPS